MQSHHSPGREVAPLMNTCSVPPFLMDHNSSRYYNQNTASNYSVMSGFQYGEARSGLPPTPPSNMQEYNDNLSSPSHSLSEKGLTASRTLRLPIRTLSHQRGPPTPDTTPPRGLDIYGRSPTSSKQLNYASSRAESFTTAREQPFSSQVDIGASLSEPKSARAAELGDFGDDVDNTTIDSASESEIEPHDAANADTNETAYTQEWPGLQISVPNEVESRPMVQEYAKTLPKLRTSPLLRSNDVSDESHTNAATSSTPNRDNKDIGKSPDSIKKFERHLLDDDLGRISATSTSSSVVQAVVLDASPRQRHSLRHAGRNLAYRLSDKISPDSPTLHDSPLGATLTHQLTHKNQKIPEGGLHLYEDKADFQRTNLRAVSDPQPKQNAPNLYSMRYSVPKGNHADSYMATRMGQVPVTSDAQMRHASTPQRNIEDFNAPYIGPAGASTTSRTYGDNNKYIIPRKRVNSSVRDSNGPLASKDLNAKMNGQGHIRDVSYQGEHATTIGPDGYTELWQKVPPTSAADTAQERTIMQDITVRRRPESSNLNILSPLRNSQASGSSSERQQIEEATRNGLVRSGSSSYRLEPRRRSSDRFSLRIEEHAMARHLYPQGTPFSHITDSQDALEVSEATAVSIFPHNNNSLLVVQQMTRSIPNARRDIISTLPSKSAQPEINLLPATPPESSQQGLPNIPLENPRKPPEPPAFQVIPPTPCQEPDHIPIVRPAPDETPTSPPRRLSLIKRARRYSDSFIQPILTQAITTRRIASQQPSGGTGTATENQKNKLHPFWRPRGFWDEFDSESDQAEDDRLPLGGDTSDVADDAKPKRRLTFRGTGGFLIGNTLGVTRAGTNVRRHHISLPARLAAQQRQSNKLAHSDGNTRGKSPYGASGKSSSGNSNSEITLIRHAGRIYKIPGLGIDFQYVGLSGLRAMMMARRRRREKRKLEERRERLRQTIGPRTSIE